MKFHLDVALSPPYLKFYHYEVKGSPPLDFYIAYPTGLISKELFLLQQDRMRIINEDSARFKAIEADLKLYSSRLLALNELINNLKVDIKRVNDAQTTLNRLFSHEIRDLKDKINSLTPVIKPEVKSKKIFNWFGRK